MKKFFAYFASLSPGQRHFLVALAILVVIPFTTLLALQIHNAANLAVLAHELALRQESWKDEARELDPRVNPESLKTSASRHAYRLLANHAFLVPERRAIVTVQVPLGDLRATNRQAISQEKLLAAANEKIQQIAEAECAMMIGRLASQCIVLSATGRPLGAEAFEYQMQLAFAEARPFGKSEPDAAYEFVVSRFSPSKAITSQRLYYAKSTQERRRIYTDIADACDAVRRRSGNCSLTGLSIASRLDRGTPMVRLSASATYATLVRVPEVAGR